MRRPRGIESEEEESKTGMGRGSSERRKLRPKNYSIGPGDIMSLGADGSREEKGRLTFKEQRGGGSGHSDDRMNEDIIIRRDPDNDDDLVYESFLKPMEIRNKPKQHYNKYRNSKRNSNSNENLQGSFGPAETGSTYLGFSENFMHLDDD